MQIMLNLNSIMIGSEAPKVLAEFYEKVFQRKADMQDSSYWGWSVGSTFFNIGEHSEVKSTSKEPARIIINFETGEVKEEFMRIKEIEGVEIITEPYNPGGVESVWIATFADPDGNYFQLMSPWEEDK